jgi:pimeloyl-ACP methyl ester carboxylesterase
MSTVWTDLLGSEVRYRGKKFRTRTIEAGQGELLLLLHGIGGHAEAYSRNLARLGRHFHVVAIDLLWHGFSSKPPVAKAMIPAYLEQVIDLLDDLGYTRASVEGESLGGWIALELARQHPQRLSKIILNTAYGVRLKGGEVKEDPQQGLAQLRERSLAAITNPTRETVRKRLEWLMAAPERVTEELVDIRHAIYNAADTQAALKDVFSISFSPDREDRLIEEEELAGISTPALVLWTDKNPGLGPAGGLRLSKLLKGAEYHCVNDSAHWPQWEKPEEHDQVVLAFLKKTTAVMPR